MNKMNCWGCAMCPVCNHTLFYHCDQFYDEEPQFYYEFKNCDITFSPEKWTTRTTPKSIKCPFSLEKLQELKIRADQKFPYHPTPHEIELLCDFAIAQLNPAPKSTEADLVLALKSYQAVVATILSEEGGNITLWWYRLVDSQIGGAKAILECKSTEAEGDKLQTDYNELIMAVGNRYPGETRHQTALKYIKWAEMPSTTDCAKAAIANEKGEL